MYLFKVDLMTVIVLAVIFGIVLTMNMGSGAEPVAYSAVDKENITSLATLQNSKVIVDVASANKPQYSVRPAVQSQITSQQAMRHQGPESKTVF